MHIIYTSLLVVRGTFKKLGSIKRIISVQVRASTECFEFKDGELLKELSPM